MKREKAWPSTSVLDPDPNPHGFGPPGSGSISQRYGVFCWRLEGQ